MACGAVISLLDTQQSRQGHWWLPDAGFPQHLASLLGSPLRASGQPPRSWWELAAVFEPLRPLPASDTPPTTTGATYRYLICLHRRGNRLSCWRRYPEGLGWQRRCGPMPLAHFIHRFNQHLISPP
ncbi:MAG: hypothetical protein NTX18_08430 [Cyanobium sp. LacPavin_0818_WC50_MAG_67_9]|nr:hypothetical protein [Cyanobium sp. LacPavin_0818_WC50_MAG_67_9]